jgi:hypothetical protein
MLQAAFFDGVLQNPRLRTLRLPLLSYRKRRRDAKEYSEGYASCEQQWLGQSVRQPSGGDPSGKSYFTAGPLTP